MALRFNPPPNWPAPPPGWQPPAGWSPDPAWGPAPEGWNLWVDDAAAGAVPPPPVAPSAPNSQQAPPSPFEAAPPAPPEPTAPLPPVPGASGAAPVPGSAPAPGSAPGVPGAAGAPSYAPANYGPAPTVGSGVNFNQAPGPFGEPEGQPQKSSKTPIIVISIISVLLIGIIVAIIALLMGGDDDTPTESASPTETATEEPTEDPTEEPTEDPTADPTEDPTEEPTAEPTEDPEPAPAGDTGSVQNPLPLGTKIVLVDNDGNEMWEVTPVSTMLDATDVIDQFNADGFITNDDPPAGQQWASITLDVVYLGPDSETPSAWDIDIAFISAGKVYDIKTLVWGNEESLQDIGEVYAGAGGTGTEYLTIPSENVTDGVWRINYAWNWSEEVNYYFAAE